MNPLIKLLVVLKIAKVTNVSPKIEEQKYDIITGLPLRKTIVPKTIHNYNLKFTIAYFSVGIILVGVLLFAFTSTDLYDNEPEPVKFGTNKQNRAFWIQEVQRLDCLELKKLVDMPSDYKGELFPDIDHQEGTMQVMAKWEYTNNERLFPSPRQDECIKELGYEKNAIERCDNWTRQGCHDYEFDRSDQGIWYEFDKVNNPIKTIDFPDDWFYIDPFTMKRYDDTKQFLLDYHPELSYYKGI